MSAGEHVTYRGRTIQVLADEIRVHHELAEVPAVFYSMAEARRFVCFIDKLGRPQLSKREAERRRAADLDESWRWEEVA